MRPWLAIVAALAAFAAPADERIADIRQGTNLAVALAPDGRTLVVDLLGQLWTLPVTGGGAVPVTPAGEQSRQPRFSPDGTRVVYERFTDDQWDVWLLDLASGDRRPLTTSPSDERQPDFAADGHSVVFASNRSGRFGLWAVELDGGGEQPLVEDSGDASFPTVSELGQLAYLRRDAGEWSIRLRTADGATTTVYTSARRLSPPSWRPGGGVLIFGEQEPAATSRVWMLLLAEPLVLKPLSDAEDLFVSRAAWLSGAEFVYSADGQLWRRGIATPTREPIHLFAASAVAVATAPEDLGELAPVDARPALGINGLARSADGRRTVFTALGDVWLAERGGVRRLTDDAFVDLDPTFTPDGESIVFASERTGQLELWRLALRDRRLTQLTFGALQPRRPALRADGKRIAYLASSSLEPWAPTTLEVLDLPNGGVTTWADDVVGAGTLAWSEDGRSVQLQAQSAHARSDAVRVETPAPTPSGGADDGTRAQAPFGVTWQPPAPPADYVVEVGRLFDGARAAYRRHVDLHVRGGRIAAIVGRGVLPAVGNVIDAREATVIPGLIDVHAHQSSLVGARLGRAWLAYGVTTVREIAPNPDEAVERGEAWASGRTPGPRLVITAEGAAPPADARKPIRPYAGITQGFVHGLRRQADEFGVPSVAKYPARLHFRLSTPANELELSPGWAIYQDGVSRLVASGATVTAGLAALAGPAAWPSPRLIHDGAYRALFTTAEQAAWERPDGLPAVLPALQQTVARLVRAGARVAVASDAPAVPYGLGVHLELALLAGAGIANDQVLRMATIEGALALGLEQELGTLEEGKLADFVVLDGDPLANIADTLRIVAVAKGGAWHERAELVAAP